MMLSRVNSICYILLLLVIICTGSSLIYAQAENNQSDEDILTEIDQENASNTGFDDSGLTFKLNGQYKDLFMYQRSGTYIGNNFMTREHKNLVSNLKRIRLSPQLKYGEALIVHIDYDNEIILSSYNKSYEFDAAWRSGNYNQLFDMTWEPYYSSDLYYRTKIHRAYLKYSVSDFTLTLGRQQIRFGSGRLWNPLDILNPVSPTSVEGGQEQTGTDALRLDYYFNEFSELSLAYSQKRHNDQFDDLSFENSNSVARFKTTINESDYALLAGWVAKRLVLGTDLGTIVSGGILRGSIVYEQSEEYDNFVIANTGYEYTFRNGIYFLVEYFFNTNPLNENNDLRQEVEMSLLTGINQSNYYLLANQFITYNSHYVGMAVGNDLHPLLRGDIFLIVDIEGQGAFINPAITFNALENLDLSAGMMVSVIRENAVKDSDFEQYKRYPFFFTSLSYYF